MLRFFSSATTPSSTPKSTPEVTTVTPAVAKPALTNSRPTSTSSSRSSGSSSSSRPTSTSSSSGRKSRGPPPKKPPPGRSPLSSSTTGPGSSLESKSLSTSANASSPSLALPTSSAPRASQVLPSVKCSQCDQPVPLSELGSHICAGPPATSQPASVPASATPPKPIRRPSQQSQSAIVVSDLQQPIPANKVDNDGNSHVAGANRRPSHIQSKSPPPPTAAPLPNSNDHPIPRAPSRSSQKSSRSNGSNGSKTGGDSAIPLMPGARKVNEIPPQKPVPQGVLPPVQREPSPGPNPGPSLQRNPSAAAPDPTLRRAPSSEKPGGYNRTNSATRYYVDSGPVAVDASSTFSPPPLSPDPGRQAAHMLSVHGIPIPDTKTGGEAGMAGVGRRGFAAAAQAALWAGAGPPSGFGARTPSPGFLGPQRVPSQHSMYGAPGRTPSPGMIGGPPPVQGGQFSPPNQYGSPQGDPQTRPRAGSYQPPSTAPNQALRDPAVGQGIASSAPGTTNALGVGGPQQPTLSPRLLGSDLPADTRGRANSLHQKDKRAESKSRSRSRSQSRYGDDDEKDDMRKRDTVDRSSRVSDASSTYTSMSYIDNLRQPVNNTRPGGSQPKRQASTSSQMSSASLGRSITLGNNKNTMSPISEGDSPSGSESGMGNVKLPFFEKLKAKASRAALGRSVSSVSSSSTTSNTTTGQSRGLGLDRIMEKVSFSHLDESGKPKTELERRRQKTLSLESSSSSIGLAYARGPSPPPVPPLPPKEEPPAAPSVTKPLSLRKKSTDSNSNSIPFPSDTRPPVPARGGSASTISSSSASSASVSSNPHKLVTKPKASFGGVTIINAADDPIVKTGTDVVVGGGVDVIDSGLLLPKSANGGASELSDSPTSPTSSSPSPTSTTFSSSKKRQAKTCVKCSKKITDGKWILIDGGAGGVMCVDDWKEMYLPKCRRCGKPIESHAVSSSDGQLKGKYHRACFNCTRCQIPFPDKTFYVFDGKPFCGFHYAEVNNSLCSAPFCGKPVEGPCAVAENGQRYHPDHFVCDWEGLSDDDSGSDSEEDYDDDAAGYGGGRRNACRNKLVDYWEVGTKRYCSERHAGWAEASLHRAMSTRGGDGNKATKRKTMFISLGDKSLL